MRPSLRLLGAELLPLERRSTYNIVPKPGVGTASKFFEEHKPARTFPQRKTYLHERYTSVLQTSKLVLVLQNNNLTAEDLTAVKLAIRALKQPAGEEPVVFEMVRGGVLKGAVRKHASLNKLTPVLSGPMLLIHTASPPSPTYMSAILSAINKATAFKPPAGSDPAPFTTSAALREPSMTATAVNPKIFCVGAVVEGEVLTPEGVATLGTLPDLGTLRAQVVGLIGAPAAQLSGVLSAAAGGQLSRVLEGLKVKLGGGEGAEEKTE